MIDNLRDSNTQRQVMQDRRYSRLNRASPDRLKATRARRINDNFRYFGRRGTVSSNSAE
jgi:hypothetical protein